MTAITKQLSEFALNARYQDIPPAAIAAAKKSILDHLGVAIAGSRTSLAKVTREYALQSGGAPDAVIIGTRFRTSPFFAAFCNGAQAHALDFDDECETWNSHPTTVILPAVLALSEKMQSSATEVLVSYIVGWEIAARIGAVVYRSMPARGGHTTPIVGTLAAAAAAARILKLSTEQIQTTLGAAASQASGLQANVGTETKPLHAGLAASNSVRAAQLAELGLTANTNILDDPIGYLMAMAGPAHEMPNLADLGTAFDITHSQCIKSYPSCYNNQRAIDSIFYLIKEHGIHAGDVAEIEFRAHPHQIKVCRYSNPKTGLEAKFSLTYSMAAPVVYGRAGIDEFSDAKVLDPQISEFLPKVKVVTMERDKAEKPYRHCDEGQLVTVLLKDGKQHSYDAKSPRGHFSNPLSWNEVTSKFTACTESLLAPKNIAHCIELVAGFESIKDINELMSAVTKLD